MGQAIGLNDNEAMTELEVTAPLDEVLEIQISGNPNLERIAGDASVRLSSMTSVTISGNPNLRVIEGFANVEALAGLVLAENDSLERIPSWSALEHVDDRTGLLITRNAPPGKLSVSRARQATIEGWQRPRRKDGT